MASSQPVRRFRFGSTEPPTLLLEQRLQHVLKGIDRISDFLRELVPYTRIIRFELKELAAMCSHGLLVKVNAMKFFY